MNLRSNPKGDSALFACKVNLRIRTFQLTQCRYVLPWNIILGGEWILEDFESCNALYEIDLT